MSDQKNKGNTDGPNGEQPILTNRQGHPVYDNQNTRTVGDRGPTVLENYQFLEKITHFDRERIPERVVHARGVGAHGFFDGDFLFGNPAARVAIVERAARYSGVYPQEWVERRDRPIGAEGERRASVDERAESVSRFRAFGADAFSGPAAIVDDVIRLH